MRLIDADAMVARFCDGVEVERLDFVYDPTDLPDMLAEMPTIDAVPVVRGEWIVQTGSYDPRETWIKCSVCNYPTTKSWGETKYCPNCGAKMDGGTDNGQVDRQK